MVENNSVEITDWQDKCKCGYLSQSAGRGGKRLWRWLHQLKFLSIMDDTLVNCERHSESLCFPTRILRMNSCWGLKWHLTKCVIPWTTVNNLWIIVITFADNDSQCRPIRLGRLRIQVTTSPTTALLPAIVGYRGIVFPLHILTLCRVAPLPQTLSFTKERIRRSISRANIN